MSILCYTYIRLELGLFMFNDPLSLKKELGRISTWLWKTFSSPAFFLYCLRRKITARNLLSQNYLVFPVIVSLLTFLVIFETALAVQNEGQIQNMLLTKINKKTEEIIVDKNLPEQSVKKFDFIIASTKDDADNFNEPTTALGGSALISPDIISDEMPVTRTGTEIYIVQAGDTLESIAKKFNISIESIAWENKLSTKAVLKPGRELTILPVSGLTHKIQAGDTLNSIAQKYLASVEDVMDFNNIGDPGDIFIGDILIVPFGKQPPAPKPIVTPPAKPKVLFVNENYSNYRDWLKNTQCHRFVSGQCTSWVAFKWATVLGRCIVWTGHAKTWLNNAKISGFRTGSRQDGPQVGAIVVLQESGWAARRYGHVAYVESFDDQNVTFTEMNFKGAWSITQRSYSRDSKQILGYIYFN